MKKYRKRYKGIKFKMISDNESITKHPGYHVWEGMKQRCYDKNSANYKIYGGRGIRICDEWKNSSVEFLLWYEKNYKNGLWIDRIDNNGNYEPDNCKFSTISEQTFNQRKIKFRRGEGVYFHKTKNKWIAGITINKKRMHLGEFFSKKEALDCRKKEEDKFLGLEYYYES